MHLALSPLFVFFFNDTATTEIYTLSLHDALPISPRGDPPPFPRRPSAPRRAPGRTPRGRPPRSPRGRVRAPRSEEHTSELQSPCNLVCRLLLEKKKNDIRRHPRGALVTTLRRQTH